MEEYHIAICDDDSHDSARLMDLIRRTPLCPESLTFYEYSDGEELMEDYQKFDAIFLDIGMKNMSGTETAQAVRRIDPFVILAFYTGIEEYASRIVPVHPFIYLNKGDSEEILFENLTLLIEEMRRKHQFLKLPVKSDGRLLLLHPSDILYVTIRRNGSELWLTREAVLRLRISEGFVKSSIELSSYYEQLSKHGFIYAHRSYIVNAEHIMMRNKNSIVLENGCELNVARGRQQEFDRELSNCLGVRYKRGERQ